jgi:hypothetical protein
MPTWYAVGYAVINIDPRGSYESGGDIQSWSEQEARDGYDVVKRAAAQDWCTAPWRWPGTPGWPPCNGGSQGRSAPAPRPAAASWASPARHVIRARRHRGVPAVPRPRPDCRVQPFPQISHQRLQRRDPLRLLPDQRIARILSRTILRNIGRSQRSSQRPAAAATATRPPQHSPRRSTVTSDHSPQHKAA